MGNGSLLMERKKDYLNLAWVVAGLHSNAG